MNIFPRWMAQAQLVNPNQRSKFTNAHMVAGDSYLERKLDVAPDFPKTILKRSETMTTDDVMHILGLQEDEYLEASVSSCICNIGIVRPFPNSVSRFPEAQEACV